MQFSYLTILIIFLNINCFFSGEKPNTEEEVKLQNNKDLIPCYPKNIKLKKLVDSIYISEEKYYLVTNNCIIDSLVEDLKPSSITFAGSIYSNSNKVYIFNVYNRCGVGIHCERYRFISIKNDKFISSELNKSYKEEIIDNGKKILNKIDFNLDSKKMIIEVDVSLSETSIAYQGSLPFSFDTELRIQLDTIKAIKLNGRRNWSVMKSDEVFRNNFNL